MKNKKHIFLFVLIIAVFSFAFQYMFEFFHVRKQLNLLVQFSLNLPACIIIGIIDYLIIDTVYKKLENENNAIRISINLVLTSLVAALFAVIANFLFSSAFNPYDLDIIKVSLPVVLWNSIIVLLIEIFFFNQRQVEAEKKIAFFEKEKIQYQYEMLKAQVNPHFLFNSLNVLSSLAYQDAEKANLFAKKMSGIYRYLLLMNTRPTVSLKEELAFLESYIFLEKIRFEDGLHVQINNIQNVNKQIIPVSLQLLMENAVKHNITTSAHPLYIRIDINKDGVVVSNNLQLRSSVEKGDVGLINLQKQYALFHKEIVITKTQAEFIVSIPFID